MKRLHINFNFDMDGTIADLYGVENWLEDLINENVRPYAEAKPLVRLSALARVLNRLQREGHKINVISWLSKNGSAEYNAKVAEVKKAWLAKHLPSVHWDNIIIVAYGTPKETLGTGILFDDEEKNRNNWTGKAFDVNAILEILKRM